MWRSKSTFGSDGWTLNEYVRPPCSTTSRYWAWPVPITPAPTVDIRNPSLTSSETSDDKYTSVSSRLGLRDGVGGGRRIPGGFRSSGRGAPGPSHSPHRVSTHPLQLEAPTRIELVCEALQASA